MPEKKRLKILIAYDGSACAESMIEDLKRAGLPRRADALILSIAEEAIPAPHSFAGVDTGFAEEELAEVKNALALARMAQTWTHALFPAWEIRSEAALGSPASEILALADAWKPDLIVVGSHGRSALGRLFFGSVSQRLVHEARCSVRVARGRAVTPENTPIRLVIGVDGSTGADVALRQVAAREWPAGSEAFLVNAAWTIPPVMETGQAMQTMEWIAQENLRVKKIVDEATETLARTGLQVTSIVREEEPKRLLCEVADEQHADCIFVGARGMGRLERVLTGSVSAGVAARANCSVEIVREN